MSVPTVEVVGVYGNGQSFQAQLAHTLPDVALLDYHLPDMTGAELCRWVRFHFQDVKMLVFTGFDKPALVTEMLESGCSGYLLKSFTDSSVLIEALDSVCAGKIYLDAHLSAMYAQQLALLKGPPAIMPNLTKREAEVLKEVVSGLSSKEISEKLHISKRTVENHRNSIMIKTSSKNLAALIKFAMDRRLI